MSRYDIKMTTDNTDTSVTGRNRTLSGMRFDVYQYVRLHEGCTRKEIATGIGAAGSSVTARVHELLAAGFLLEPSGKRKMNKGTGKRVRTLVIADDSQGRPSLDKVRVKVRLVVDADGNYGAYAHVVGGRHIGQSTRTMLTKCITMSPPRVTLDHSQSTQVISKSELLRGSPTDITLDAASFEEVPLDIIDIE